MQRDPSGYVDGMGVYQFAASSPLSATDSMGLYSSFADDAFCFGQDLQKRRRTLKHLSRYIFSKTLPAIHLMESALDLLLPLSELRAVKRAAEQGDTALLATATAILGLQLINPFKILRNLRLPFAPAAFAAKTIKYSRKANKYIKQFGLSTNRQLTRNIQEAAKMMGFKGKVVVLSGKGGGQGGGAMLKSGEMIIFEKAYKKGITVATGRGRARRLQGNALVAHEVGHTLAQISYKRRFLTSKSYNLREVQASTIGSTLKGLTDKERDMLLKDAEIMFDMYSGKLR